MKNLVTILFFLLSIILGAQEIQILNSEQQKVSFRGLSVIDNSTLWVSGSNGIIGRSVNGGEVFEWIHPKGFENRDFRAIAAFDSNTAIAVVIASPAVVIKTTDGGKTWKEVYRDDHEGAFLDDISFESGNLMNGIIVGDPIDGKAYFLKTVDGGENWSKIEELTEIPLEESEAFFAASNSNIKMTDDNFFMVVSGGGASNLILCGMYIQKIKLAKTDSNTAGANGLDYSNSENYGLIAGGDFMNPKTSDNNLFIFEFSEDGVPQISQPQVPPSGYKSGVAIIENGRAISCGMSNVDYSKDKGLTWLNISKTGFHTCKKARNGTKVFLAGANGKIGFLSE